jgi:hypothetical protein
MLTSSDLAGFEWDWRRPTDAGDIRHAIQFLWPADVTDVNPPIPESLTLRLLCHRFVDELPDAEMPDLLGHLRLAAGSILGAAPLPTLPKPRRIAAKKGRTFERPTFSAEEE